MNWNPTAREQKLEHHQIIQGWLNTRERRKGRGWSKHDPAAESDNKARLLAIHCIAMNKCERKKPVWEDMTNDDTEFYYYDHALNRWAQMKRILSWILLVGIAAYPNLGSNKFVNFAEAPRLEKSHLVPDNCKEHMDVSRHVRADDTAGTKSSRLSFSTGGQGTPEISIRFQWID